MDQLLKDFELQIESLEIIPSDGGRFEVTVNGDLVYSKKKTGRHAEIDEVRKLLQAKVK